LACPATAVFGTPDRGIAPARHGSQAVRSGRLADLANELRHLPQRRTVLQVVGQQLPLPRLVPGRLPPGPPHQALQPRGVGLGPRTAQAAGHVLQAVRVGREVQVGVDQRQDVYQPLQHSVRVFFPPRRLPHPPEEGPLVAAVAEHQEVLVAAHLRQEPLEDVPLLLPRVRPEGEPLLRVPPDDGRGGRDRSGAIVTGAGVVIKVL
jgi:hypothetical protein